MAAGEPPQGGAVVERVFAANVDAVPDVIAFIAGEAGAWGLHPRRLMQLELAVEEAVVNICLYAYEVPPGELLVRIEPGESRFVVELIDEGVPFDPLAVEEPDLRAGAEDRAVGGLGIFLVRRVMDEVAYLRDGSRNILRLVIHAHVRRVVLIAAAALCVAAVVARRPVARRPERGRRRPPRERARWSCSGSRRRSSPGTTWPSRRASTGTTASTSSVVPGGPGHRLRSPSCRAARPTSPPAFLSGALSAAAQGAPLVDVGQVVNRSSLMIVARRSVDQGSRRPRRHAREPLGDELPRRLSGLLRDAPGSSRGSLPQYYSVNLFLQGGVDACAAMEYNEYHTILQAGVDAGELTTFFMRDDGFGFPEDGIYTLAATARQRPAVCREFAAASLRGLGVLPRAPRTRRSTAS